MDTCIAIRTMTFKDGIAYLQAGGGIVYDSVEEDEYMETINKLKGNVRALERAERTCNGCACLPLATLTSLDRILARYPGIWCWHLSITQRRLCMVNIDYVLYIMLLRSTAASRPLCNLCARFAIFSNCSWRIATPSRPAMLRMPATSSAVRVLSSLAGIGYITIRGSTFESTSAIVGTCKSAHSRIACRFGDRKSTRLNSSHSGESRMPSSA